MSTALKAVKGIEAPPESRAKVPSRFCLDVCRHSKPKTSSLFQHVFDEEFEQWESRPVPPELLKSFENIFTSHELELIIAVFAWQENGAAVFKSKYEWALLASGNPASDYSKYYRAIETLQQPHQVLSRPKMRYHLDKEPPVVIRERREENDKGEIEELLIISLGESIKRGIESFYLIPLALSLLLRKGGLKRVQTCHIKQYFHIFKLASKRREGPINIDLSRVYESAGISHYFDKGYEQGPRARKLINNGFRAMMGAGMLISFKHLGGNHATIEPNRFHFKPEKKRPSKQTAKETLTGVQYP